MFFAKTNIWLALLMLLLISAGATWYLVAQQPSDDSSSTSFFPQLQPEPPRPLLAYSIPQLPSYPLNPSSIEIESVQEQTNDYTEYVFVYTTMGKKMSGQLNVPQEVKPSAPVIILIRGYVPPEIFETGTGTKNAAKVFAQHGFITIAPDFFGYGLSDSEPEDPWEARFIKPVNVLELLASIRTVGVPLGLQTDSRVQASNIGIWAHSNGGQIALTTLEALNEPIPTTLWAPVTAPFPYSILFFGDEEEDEGKAQRAWIALFEKTYDVFDFSLTKHLDRLRGPLRIHHGTSDDAALYVWSSEFAKKIEAENENRDPQSAIDFKLITHPGADHNLQPASDWNAAIASDLKFFDHAFAASAAALLSE